MAPLVFTGVQSDDSTRSSLSLEGDEKSAIQFANPVTVKAPFTVVDDAGKTVASVLNDAVFRGIRYFDAKGNLAGRAGCNADGSSLIVAESNGGSTRALLGADPSGFATVQVFQRDQLCAAIGNSTTGPESSSSISKPGRKYVEFEM